MFDLTHAGRSNAFGGGASLERVAVARSEGVTADARPDRRASEVFGGESAAYFQRDIFTTGPVPACLFARYAFMAIAEDASADAVLRDLRRRNVDRLVFSNPYRSPLSTRLYNACRQSQFPILVVERGCLPNTTFICMQGFMLDSTIYRAPAWDFPVSEQLLARLYGYIHLYHSGSLAPLEPQPERRGTRILESKPDSLRKPRILITLQMPTDTVTRVFAGPGRGYDDFLAFAASLVERFGDVCDFSFKPHPRAPELAIACAADARALHIDDALEDCDGVLTYNSGTGVLAFLHGKPVATFGRAFYDSPGLTVKTTTVDEFAQFLARLPASFDRVKRERFLCHLLFRVLSDVRFLHYPLLASRTTAFIRYKVARLFDAGTGKVFENPVDPMVDRPSRLADARDLTRAAGRWTINRIYR